MSILHELEAGIESSSDAQTQAIAAELAVALPPSAILSLEGDLGAGKTTFVKGLARAWNIATPVTSPTYTLCQVYQGARCLLHVDAYRLNPERAALDELMLDEYMQQPFCLAIEWAANLGELPWPLFGTLKLEHVSESQRSIRLERRSR